MQMQIGHAPTVGWHAGAVELSPMVVKELGIHSH